MRISVILIITINMLAGNSPAIGFDKPIRVGMPRVYICETTDHPPVIDGLLHEAIWQNTTWTEDFVNIRGQSYPAPRYKTACAMRWDHSNFYIAARLFEPHVQGSLNQDDAGISEDNNFGVFIDPDGDNHLTYQLKINALNTVQNQLLDQPFRDDGQRVKSWNIEGLQSAVHVDGTINDSSDKDRGWTVEIAIPWKILRQYAGRPTPPEMGHIWRVNFSRLQWRHQIVNSKYERMLDPQTGIIIPEDYWVWSPQGIFSMNYPEGWSEVLFVDSQYDGHADRTLNANREHDSINSARALMDIYFGQRQWFETHGAYAQTIAEIEMEQGKLMKPWLTQIETVDGEIFVLPYRWTLKMEADDQGFLATLCSPRGLMTVDESGRLKRNPLNSPEECSCLKTAP